VTSVKFSFYDYKKKEWKEEWNTIGADGLQYLAHPSTHFPDRHR